MKNYVCKNVILEVWQVCVSVYFYNNKVVEGSGSKGTPKYMGESVTYGVF